ncbi:F-box domain protein [Aspergillus mulundensis]|uniref:F-box domain-containing protein n=1 Tax=Aspergillus mulundensis TaxID=1810919 RepID=A0A3D8Q7W4_9EURO|nr:hypothetical protein DSM5745_11292 [Aspergillus mulundensis]RDW57912.1 hypothetical protein DSM5745_11292 [Aspergillus mulundensis]
MEEDVRLHPPERLGGGGESLVESDTTQQRQTTESHVLHKKAPGMPAPQDMPGTPFSRLPRTVIEQILHVADASTFASLALLNRKWRRISNSPLLYGHHLSQCPSFALSQKATDANRVQTGDLAVLKRQFFSEIRRNGFDVYFRPHQILVKLISTSMSSSTAFPRGEAFRFAFSQNGQLILCISSSRIVVLDVAAEPPAVKYELKTLRRPLHATILDDGSLLAVVSSSHQVNIYTLSNAEAKLVQNLKLNDVPRTLALSPAGSVLAIAYNDMIEVYAVGEGALATERRAVRCAGVDSLSFSSDGVILLGSSDNTSTGSLVTITVPLYGEQEPEISIKDVQIQMWTTQILFPEVVHDYSYACLLPLHTEGEGSWIMGYDNKLGTFRATGLNKSSSGTIYFASPVSEDTNKEHPPMMLASADCEGELVALGFQDSGVWVYGLPDRLDIAPVTQNASESQARPRTAQSQSTVATDTGTNISRLQQTITRPKVLINGHKVTDISGITAAHWVKRNYSIGQPRRLAAVAPGGVDNASFGDEDVPLDGGRILLLDFACSATNGNSTELTIEIGEAEPVMLREPNSSLDTEVELERRRTRIHRGNTGRGNRESYPAASSSNRPRARRISSYLSASSSEVADGEIPPILDSPYDNTQPRSQDTLRRAATAAAANRRRVAQLEETRRAIQESPVPAVFQVPHESDADNWVPPPPPYSREADAPLPDYLRRTLLPPTRRYGQNAAESFRRSLSTRFSSESSSRPSLHRLNTITGPSLTSRMRRNVGETSTSDNHRRHTSLIRGRAGPGSQAQPLSSVNESTVPAQPRVSQMVPIAVPAAPNGTTLIDSIAPTIQTQAQPMPIQVPNHTQFNNSQLDMPAVPPTPPAMNNYLYSLSSPNLIPEHLMPETPETPTPVQHTSARQHDRTQSYDYQPPLSAAALRNRRASTDPTHSSAQSVAPEQQWRRRIEEWNERTIYERSKKRSKCVIM